MYELLADEIIPEQATRRLSQDMTLRFEESGSTVDTIQHVVARENVPSL